MLKQRLITAGILIPLVVWATFSLPDFYFGLVAGLIVAIAAWEWAALVGISTHPSRVFYAGVVVLMLWGVAFLPTLPILMVALIGWLIGLCWVVRFPHAGAIWRNPQLGAVVGFVVLVPFWLALVELRSAERIGPFQVLFLLSMIWLADTAAYFAGRRWGSRKLASQVSPKKTWEGLWAALLAVGAYASSMTLLLSEQVGRVEIMFVMLCVVTVLFSVLGDLFESMFKRQAGLKDSGTLLPGHGGLLDRIDSLTAAVPIFLLGKIMLGWLA